MRTWDRQEGFSIPVMWYEHYGVSNHRHFDYCSPASSPDQRQRKIYIRTLQALCNENPHTIHNNKHVYHQSQVRKPTGCGVEWAECSLITGMGCRVQVLAWSSTAQSVWQRTFSLLANWGLRHWVWILHSAEEDNLSPFDSKIACLCQSIEINNNRDDLYTPLTFDVIVIQCLCLLRLAQT